MGWLVCDFVVVGGIILEVDTKAYPEILPFLYSPRYENVSRGAFTQIRKRR